MLTLVMLVNYADRQLVSILVQPIKQDLGITDAQVGLLAGFAFSAMYAISAGASIGIGIALAAGGVLETYIGWRNTFLLLGLSGLLLSLAVWMTMGEPRRGLYAHLGTLAPTAKPTRGAIRTLLADQVFLFVLFANWLSVLTVFGAAQWTPAFIERSFGSSRSEIGALLGATQSVSMLAGMILGGLLTDRLARSDAIVPYRIGS